MSDILNPRDSQYALLKDNEGIIHKLCFMYSDNQEEYKDLRQEVSYQLLKSYPKYKGESKLSTWVYKVVLYTALAYIRSKPKGHHPIDNIDFAIDEKEDNDWNIVLEQIKKLPDVEKSLVFLYLEGNSYKEIAEILGITESNVGVKLNRIKNKLKEYFKE
ncbi:MAG: sigma-70 family RNA polymerase sigma factor [Bacteroidota bacterium]